MGFFLFVVVDISMVECFGDRFIFCIVSDKVWNLSLFELVGCDYNWYIVGDL